MTTRSRTLTRIRLAAHHARASRTPFVLLVVCLLGGGLLTLLLLNTALNQGSFELGRLQRENTRLTDEQQALQRELDALSAPGELERRARELGMIPGGDPVFIDPTTGRIMGIPEPAPAKRLPTLPAAPVPASPTPRAGAAATPSAEGTPR